jgi:hypothetical protein
MWFGICRSPPDQLAGAYGNWGRASPLRLLAEISMTLTKHSSTSLFVCKVCLDFGTGVIADLEV